jgi:DNA invertase Pin-like site-specific DNA recombinase
MTAAAYARVSTPEQDPAAQVDQLRAYCRARGWELNEYVDHGVSGAKARRPGLDALVQAVRRRQVDVVVCTKLDRLARSLEHLVALGEEFKALGIDLVVLDQAIDTTTAAGRAMFGMLAVFAEFERDLIRDRVVAGLQRAKALGKRIGRPPSAVSREQVVALREAGLSYRGIGRRLRISPALAHRLAHDQSLEDSPQRSQTSPVSSETGPRSSTPRSGHVRTVGRDRKADKV